VDSGIVLLAEDDQNYAELFVRSLRVCGFESEVVVVGDGVEALEYLFGEGEHAERDPHAMPHLVVLDINMPRMTGLEALGRIRDDERTQRLPVVMLSARASLEDVHEAYRLGANAFIDKVSAPVSFLELVQSMAHFWLVLNEPPPVVSGPAGSSRAKG
jgi:two-component system, response regulator